MRKNKGFTLIELLAVIVILAVIALIATPLILGVIERTQKSAYEASLRSVFSATELYIASTEFSDIPEEGIPIIDENIRLKNKEFTSGKIIKNEQGEIVLQDVSNGVYCGGGTLDNLVVVKGSCYSSDTTPPTDVTLGFGTITSNSIEIVASAMDVESAISGYEFSSDDGATWTSKQTSNVYTFTNLTNNTEYTFKIRATNNNNLTTESNSLLVSTNDIPLPTYSIDNSNWTSNPVVVTITYPERETGYIYEYSLDSGTTWEEVASPSTTQNITFNSNGNVIARISDGTNIVSGTTYQVTNIDITSPVIAIDPTELTVLVGSTYTDSGVTATDAEMGDITSDIAVTGSVDTSVEGTYTLTYNVSDGAGNVASEVTRTVNVLEGTYTYSYIGNYQTFTPAVSGTYKLEVWGAQGGSSTTTNYWGNTSTLKTTGGKGGYSYGVIDLTAGQTIYIYVGGQGGNISSSFSHPSASFSGTSVGGWNGGGDGARSGFSGGGGGGGATDIRIGGTALSNRVIVAGAGGGGGGGGSTNPTYGGNGGDSGLNGSRGLVNASYGSAGNPGTAATLSSSIGSDAASPSSSSGAGAGGGGGGGYYAGTGASVSTGYSPVESCNGLCSGGGSGGGGGSGYIGGVSNGQIYLGNVSFPAPGGGSETGHTGHGYAKITFISQ